MRLIVLRRSTCRVAVCTSHGLVNRIRHSYNGTRLKSVTAPVRPNRFCQESLISSEFEQIELFRAHHHAHDQSDLRVHDHVLTYDEVTILTTFSFV